MKINNNQKSVLTLFVISFVGLLIAHDILSIGSIVWFVILACWFYGVRTKPKLNSVTGEKDSPGPNR
jgi:hypothetical protein